MHQLKCIIHVIASSIITCGHFKKHTSGQQPTVKCFDFSAACSQFYHIQKANKEEYGMLTELPTEPQRWRNYDLTPVLLSPPSHPGQRGLTALER